MSMGFGVMHDVQPKRGTLAIIEWRDSTRALVEFTDDHGHFDVVLLAHGERWEEHLPRVMRFELEKRPDIRPNAELRKVDGFWPWSEGGAR